MKSNQKVLAPPRYSGSNFSKAATVSMFATIAILAWTGADAASVENISVNASWNNFADTGPQNGSWPTEITNTQGATTISWGEPAGGPRSDYTFDSLATGNQDSPFTLGWFTHNNQPVFDPVITSVDLFLTITGSYGEESFSFTTSIGFTHEETENSGDCPYGGPDDGTDNCDDRVTIANLPLTEVQLNAGTLTFSLLGFENTAGFFNTAEETANSAPLRAEFDFEPKQPAPIPLPAAGWMLIAGIGGLVAMKRRQKARV